jgi:hypothetical protein
LSQVSVAPAPFSSGCGRFRFRLPFADCPACLPPVWRQPPPRPGVRRACRRFAAASWPVLLGCSDDGSTHCPIVFTHPRHHEDQTARSGLRDHSSPLSPGRTNTNGQCVRSSSLSTRRRRLRPPGAEDCAHPAQKTAGQVIPPLRRPRSHRHSGWPAHTPPETSSSIDNRHTGHPPHSAQQPPAPSRNTAQINYRKQQYQRVIHRHALRSRSRQRRRAQTLRAA